MADKHRRDVNYKVGDRVLFKLHPYKQQIAFKRVYQKLSSQYFGPYKIEKKMGHMAYHL